MGILLSKPEQALDGSSAYEHGDTVTHLSLRSRKRYKTRDRPEEKPPKRRKRVSTSDTFHSNDPSILNDMSPITMDVAARRLNSNKNDENSDQVKKPKPKRSKVTLTSFENSSSRGNRSISAGGVLPAGDNLHQQPTFPSPQSTSDCLRTPSKSSPKRKVPTSPYFTSPGTSTGFEAKKLDKGSKISVVENEIDLPSLPHFRPTSPDEFGLIQEKLRHDPWKMLVAVIFLNVTTAKMALPLLGQLFERWPTPEALSQANFEELVAFLYPIGLYNTRARRLIDFSAMWLSNPPQPDVLTVRKGLSKYPPTPISHLPGMGIYALDSWRMFCAGEEEWRNVQPSDKELQAWMRWRWARDTAMKE